MDIRELAEWNQFHFECAVHIPLSGLSNGVGIDQLKKLKASNKKIYLHCHSGSRVRFAKQILNSMGCDNVSIIPIGMNQMHQHGFKLSA